MPWNDLTIARLIDLDTKRVSPRKIAERMSLEFGHKFTRNAILGKIHRMGLHKNRPPANNNFVSAPIPVFRPRDCQWPIGHPGQEGFHMCGGHSLPGKPYCADHCQKAYRVRVEAAE